MSLDHGGSGDAEHFRDVPAAVSVHTPGRHPQCVPSTVPPPCSVRRKLLQDLRSATWTGANHCCPSDPTSVSELRLNTRPAVTLA
jgi:hypothetical protein